MITNYDLVDECEINIGNSRFVCDAVLTVTIKMRGIYYAAYCYIVSIWRLNMAAEIEFPINTNMDNEVTTIEEDTEGGWCIEMFDVEKFLREWEEEVNKLPYVPYEKPSQAEEQEEFQNW